MMKSPLEKARLKRDEAKRMLADGIDPAEKRNNHRDKRRSTLENIFEKIELNGLRFVNLKAK